MKKYFYPKTNPFFYFKCFALLLVLALSGTQISFAQTKTWTNSGLDNLWSNPFNWSPVGVPTGTDNVVFDGTVSNANCIINVNVNVNNFEVQPVYTSSITVGAGINVFINGTLIQDNGTLDFTQASGVTISSNVLIDANFISTSNTLALGGDFVQTSGSFNNSGGIVRLFNTGTKVIDITSPLFDFVQDPNVVIDLLNDITINGYAEFDALVNTFASPTLFLNGNVNINKDANIRVSVFFGGTTDQIIDGTDAVINGLNTAGIEVNKPSGNIVLNKPLVLDASNVTLRLVNGRIISTATNYLQMGDAGGSAYSFQDYSANSFIDGTLYFHTIISQSTYFLPLGKNGKYAPMQLENYSGGVGVQIQVEYFNTIFDEDFNTSASSPLNKISRKEYWTFNYTLSFGSADVRLFWNDGAFSQITNPASLTVANRVFQSFTGLPANWQNFNGTASGTAANGSIVSPVSDLDEAQAFTFGSTLTTQSINPLGLLPGDACLNPIALSIGTTNIAFNINETSGASGTDVNTDVSCDFVSFNGVRVQSNRWATFTGDGNRVSITYQKQPGDNTVLLKVYETGDCINFTELACDYASSNTDLTLSELVNTTMGKVYYVRVARTNGTGTDPVFGDLSITTPSITLTADPLVPAGDLFGSTSQNVVYAVKLDNPNADDILNQMNFTTSGTYIAGEVRFFEAYLSNDAVFDSNDSYLGSSNSSIGAGETISFSAFASIPNGTNYLFLTASMDSDVTEGNTLIINGLNASNFQFSNSISIGTFPLSDGGTQTLRELNNNYCEGATEVVVQSSSCNIPVGIPASYTNEGAALTGACAGLTSFKDAWIRVNNVNGLGLSVEYTSTNQNAAMAIYQGDCKALTQIACVNDLTGAGTETIDFFPATNGNYFIRIMNVESNSELLGSFCIRTQAQAPAGDLCKNGTALTVGVAATPFNITNSFRNVESLGVAGCTNDLATLDGWRNFTANSNYTSVSYQNTNKNSAITVYTGTCGALTEVACLDDVPATGTEVLNLGTTIGTTYYVRIINALDNNSMNGNIRVFNTPAFTPTNLIASNIISTDFTLTWDPVINADSYRIDVATTVNFVAGTFVGTYNNLTEATNTLNITGLTAGTTYYCRVRGANVGGTSANSAILTVTTLPNIPVALDATGITQTKFTAHWEDVLGADSYRIDISTDNFATFVSGFNNRNVGLVSSFTVVGLTANTTYQYRVRASLNSTQSDNSNVIITTTLPNPPSATTVTAATNISDISFTANWNVSANATEYFLDVATNAAFTNFVDGFQSFNVSNVLTYDVTGLAGGTNYFYRIRAGNPGGVSAYSSNTTTVLTAPIAPNAIAATDIASISFTANWQASPTAQGYLLDVAENDLFTIFVAGFNGADVGNITNTTVTGLVPATNYFYRVRAYNNGGVAVSSNSTVISVSTITTAPIADPASGVLLNGFTANWQSVPNASSYQIDISTDDLFTNFVTGYDSLNVGNVLLRDITDLQAGTTYYYRVRAVNAGGNASNNSNSIAQITLPAAPLALAANPIAGLSFRANWQASPSAEGYFLDIATDNLFANFVAGYQDLDVSNVTSFQVTGLDFETNYFYRIRAVNDGGLGFSANSNIISVTTTPDLPAAPLALAATLITANSFTANWQSVPTATKYFVDISLSDVFANFAIQNQDVGNVNLFNFTGLTAGQTYYYRVRSFDAVGTSLNSNSIAVQLNVGTPTAVSATNLNIQPVNSSFQANWNPVLGATSYRLDVSRNANFIFGSFVAGFNDLDVGNATSFAVTGLDANETYFYRIRAFSSSSTSANSNVIEVNLVSNNSGIPTSPSGLSLFALSESAVEVSWNDNSDNENLFELQRSLQFIGGYTTIHNANANPNTGRITYIDEDNGNGLLPKTRYFYRVRAVGNFGNSAFTPRDSVTTLSGASVAPTNLEATTKSNTEISLTWVDNSNNEDGFYLYRATEDTDFALIATINADITEYQDTGLQNNTVYFYLITTFKGLAESDFSNLATATTAPVPIAPNSLVATAIAKDKIVLNWQDNSSDETLFLIEMASVFSDDIFQYLDIVATNQTSFTVNNLVANQVYRFRVAAVNLDGLSPYTRPDTAKTFIDANVNLPNEPINLSAEPVSTIEISLRWQDNSTNEDLFIIERADSELGPYEEIDRVLRNSTNYSDVGLTSGQTYYYRIFASNGGGISISSDTVSAQAVCNIITVINTDIANNGTIACDTKEVLLNLNTNISVGRFQWFRNDVVIPDAILPSHIASQSGEYYCRIVAGDCDKSSATTSIIIRPSFGVDIALVVDTLLNQNNFEEYIYRLEANLVGVSNYQWYYNYEPIAGATSEEYFPKESGTYYVVVTDQGCSATSNLISLTVTALEDNDFSKSLKLSPNPTDGILQLDLETNILGDYQINLLDQTGRRFALKKGKKETAILKETLDLVNFAEGLYFIEIRLKNQVAVRKVIKY